MIPREQRTKRARQLFDQPEAKPPYRVPTMAEIRALKWNGLSVVSLFAGAGGSSLGYRMAGYRVFFASEFVEAAQQSYRANMGKWTTLDGRDVKLVQAAEIAKVLKRNGVDELDLLDGSPPCTMFSTAGKREKGWGGKGKTYSNGVNQNDEKLFEEYIRIRDGLMPRAFVAENVSGLVKGAAKGFFLEILRELKRGYRVEARVVDAQWLGVPQQRQRVIFVGVREDLGLEPAFPAPFPYRYSVRDALPWLGSVRFDNGGGMHQAKEVAEEIDTPVRTIIARKQESHLKVADAAVVKNSNASFAKKHKGQRHDLDEISPTVMARRPNIELEVGVAHGHNGSRRAREEGRVDSVDEPLPTLMAGGGRTGRNSQLSIEYRARPGAKGWRPGAKLQETRHRSFDEPAPAVTADGFSAAARHQVAIIERAVEAEADISRYAIGDEYDKLNPGQSSDKYFSLVRADPSKPCPTLTTAPAFAPSAAAVVHPTEKRRFSIAELKQLCAFPPDFELTGSYAQQWERLGNSVPPLMMKAIAEAVRDHVLLPARAADGRSKARRRARRSRRGASRPGNPAAPTPA